MIAARLGGASLAVLAGAGPLATPAPAAPDTIAADVALRSFDDWQAEIMGGTGMPTATQGVLDAFQQLYLSGYDGLTPNALTTPEAFYAVTGIKSLTFDQSLAQSVPILDDAIHRQITDGHNVVVVGHSQGATVASMEMQQLLALPEGERPDPASLHFVLTGDPNNPFGGIMERFAGLSLPSMGVTFGGETPLDTPYQTDIYTAEYDGYADFPKYPLNLLADLNAGAGMIFVHPAAYLDPDALSQAITLGTDGDITYHILPTENLPLLEPLRLLPFLGTPLADLLQPDLKILVDLGYGADGVGYSSMADGGDIGLAPDVDLGTVLGQLAAGAQTGFNAFVDDLGHLSAGPLGDLSTGLGDLAANGADTPGDVLTADSALTELGALAGSFATAAYSWLLPTADAVTALLTGVPAYDLSLAGDGLQTLLDGDPAGLLDAIGKPIAADLGLLMLAGGWWAQSVLSAISEPVSELGGFVADLSATMEALAP